MLIHEFVFSTTHPHNSASCNCSSVWTFVHDWLERLTTHPGVIQDRWLRLLQTSIARRAFVSHVSQSFIAMSSFVTFWPDSIKAYRVVKAHTGVLVGIAYILLRLAWYELRENIALTSMLVAYRPTFYQVASKLHWRYSKHKLFVWLINSSTQQLICWHIWYAKRSSGWMFDSGKLALEARCHECWYSSTIR